MTTIPPPERVIVTRVVAQPSPEQATEHMVRMRDGVRLATDVYLPAERPPGAAVLIRLPYDKAGSYTYMPLVAARFARAGYAVVVQDVRGKFRSGGETLPWINETADAYDTLDWIVQQEWSNGCVGMWGESYYGFTQWAAVASGHPALRAIVPRMTGTRLGGPIEDDHPEWFINRVYRTTHFAAHDTFDWQPRWQRPFVQEFEAFFAAIGARPAAWDVDFPTPGLLRRFPTGHPFDARAIPTLLTLGWFDNCLHFGWQDYAELVRRPAWRALVHLRIEAVDHEGYHVADAPVGASSDHMRDRAAMARVLDRLTAPAIEFFDVYVRDQETPPPPRVAWEHVHDGWREAPAWPVSEAIPRTLHLSAAGTLSLEAEAAETRLAWTHDPESPVPSPYTNTFALLLEYADEREWTSREDVLAFDGTAARAPLDLCGPAHVEAVFDSTGPYADIFARLLDVAPDGTARLITRGQTRVRALGDRVDISLAHLGYRLRPGHRLRLQLAGSDAPEYVTGPGTDEHPWLATETERNVHSVRVGGEGGARLVVSTVPA